VQLEDQVRPQDEAPTRDAVAQAPEDPLDAGAQLRVVIRLGDVVLRDLGEQSRLAVAGVDRGEDDDGKVGAILDLPGEGQAVVMTGPACSVFEGEIEL
jgi:hypothetical protein